MKYRYQVESHPGEWYTVTEGTRAYCQGWFDARRSTPGLRLACRVVHEDGRVIMSAFASNDLSLGMLAGCPSAEQYEAAAERAMAIARQIWDHEARRAEHKALRDGVTRKEDPPC